MEMLSPSQRCWGILGRAYYKDEDTTASKEPSVCARDTEGLWAKTLTPKGLAGPATELGLHPEKRRDPSRLLTPMQHGQTCIPEGTPAVVFVPLSVPCAVSAGGN